MTAARDIARAAPGTALEADAARPVLHLSGARLREALEAAIAGCEDQGGIERYVDACKLKARLFEQALVEGDPATLDVETLKGLCTFMATVRRRIGAYLDADGLMRVRRALATLLDGHRDTATADARLAAFCANFAENRRHRWVRDFAAEVLHNVAPEHYPLMTRWVWDQRANTGVLREIWFGPDTDARTLPVADDFAFFLTLREELSVFLSDNGFFRDMPFYVDVLLAQVYAGYICAQGGTYLRADFSSPEDPMVHTRRMLGLDGVRAGSTKTRLKSVEGTAFVLDDAGD